MSEIEQVPNALLGIDISHYQGSIDWAQVFEAGVKFAFIKATDGANSADPMCKANCDGAREAGVPYGLYHFWRPQDAANAQADNFLRTVTDAGPSEFAVALDIETGSLTEENQEQALEWLARVDQTLLKAQRPLVYVSPSYAQVNLTDELWLQYPLWAAHYTNLMQPNTSRWPSWMFWQRQGDGQVPGVSTAVDIDWFHGGLDDFAKLIQVPT